MKFQRGTQGARVDVIVLDGIARDHHLDAPEPVHVPQHAQLDVCRQRGRDAIRINEIRVEPLRLEEDLVPLSVPEPMDLVFNRGAIAWPGRPDRSREERRSVEICADEVVRLLVRTRDGAENFGIATTVR